ncbi:MAG TPA: Lrp/AsnC family transcriptional regulator [Candidatus Nanoarchaeia archaeon]|nr:Lrp/AsnC family transcriptional regulator [Candidatus Nanoarchaeia archaeon]
MEWVKIEGAEYGNKLYKMLMQLSGTDELLAYSELFPEDIHASPENPDGYKTLRAHYEIMSDERTRKLLAALYKNQQNGRLSLEQLAESFSLKEEELKERLKFFRESGMKEMQL